MGQGVIDPVALAAAAGAAIAHWTEVATAAAALVALALSARSNGTARKALRLAEVQEARRQPRVATYLRAHHQQSIPGGRTQYAFDVTISSQSDADNAIVEATLHLSYRVSEVPIVAKIPQDPGRADGALGLPVKLGARDAISGWCRFAVDDGVLDGAMADLLAVVLTDSFGNEYRVEAQILRAPPR
ncbi:hypothetical protein [Phenylobacterium sp.]|uniref:hypothetical protein n=1 Tax=Phenylobacterium sp. TaxID=1871053 RepID=UPI0025D57226|nr:hypothetical protein [Phenylobacterium sp.]MBX3482406.1 hypothetical protein [Phenylobacterium sp.]MCW5758200.1 hypothetical protein [Phenylobacterium sp.]